MPTKTKEQNALAVIDMRYDGNVFIADFKSMEKAALAYAKQFDNLPIVTEEDRKQAKRIRAEINSKIKEVDEARIDLFKKYDQPKIEFKSKCDAVIEILQEQVKYIDDGIKRKDAEFLANRKKLLLIEYEAVAEELMEHIPLERYTAKESNLLGRTWGDAKACKALADMIIDAVRDRETIKASCHEYHVEADMTYCRTLDLRAALDKHKQLVEEHRERIAHENKMREVALVDEPTPEPAPVQTPKPTSGYPSPAKRRGEPVQAWRHDFMATRTQVEMLASYARSLGIKSDGIKERLVK